MDLAVTTYRNAFVGPGENFPTEGLLRNNHFARWAQPQAKNRSLTAGLPIDTPQVQHFHLAKSRPSTRRARKRHGFHVSMLLAASLSVMYVDRLARVDVRMHERGEGAIPCHIAVKYPGSLLDLVFVF